MGKKIVRDGNLSHYLRHFLFVTKIFEYVYDSYYLVVTVYYFTPWINKLNSISSWADVSRRVPIKCMHLSVLSNSLIHINWIK